MLVALLAVPLAQGAWHELGGDASRSGAIQTGPGPLDVAVVIDFLHGGWAFPPGATVVSSPDAELVVAFQHLDFGANNAPACNLTVFDDYESTFVPLPDASARCPLPGSIVAYDEGRGVVLYCLGFLRSDSPVLFASHLDGTLAWTARPKEGVNEAAEWNCAHAAIDSSSQTILVPFNGLQSAGAVAGDARPGVVRESARNTLRRLDLGTGTEVWTVSVPLPVFENQTPEICEAENACDLDALPASENLPRKVDALEIESVSLTSTGIGVLVASAGETGFVGLDPAGRFRWAEMACGSAPGLPARSPCAPGQPRAGSRWGGSRGELVATVMGPEVAFFNPIGTVSSRRLTFPAATAEFDGPAYAGTVWLGPRAIVSGLDGVFAFTMASAEPEWSWAAEPGHRVIQVAPRADGNLLILTRSTAGNTIDLHEVDGLDGRTRGTLPMPFGRCPGATGGETGGTAGPTNAAVMLDTPRGLLVATCDGNATYLQPLPGAALEVDNEYPAPGQPVGVRIAEDVRELIVAWGDGEVTRTTDQAATHAYTRPTSHVLRATAVYDDSTTSSSEFVVHVGQERPRKLTPLQTAFAPENQNLTFALFGLALTAGGALIAGVARQRRRGRLDAELGELERLRAVGVMEPDKAVHGLDEFRARLMRDLKRGRLDDAQAGLLEARIARLVRALRLRVLGGAVANLSPHYRHLFDAALEDGRLNAAESLVLLDQLATETRVAPADRQRIADCIREWSQP